MLFGDADDARLITLQTVRRPFHPWAVDVLDVAALRVGLPCSSDGSRLNVGTSWTIPLNDVRVDTLILPAWTPREARRALGRVEDLQDVLDRTPPPSDEIFRGSAPGSLASAHPREFLEQVVGHGPGSTPSGDDYSVGRLAVLWALVDVSPQAARQIKEVQRVFRWEKLKERTPLGSAQMVLSAANGRFCRAVASLILSIGIEGSRSTSIACGRVLSLGSSSGGATLAGIVDGLRCAGDWLPSLDRP